MPPVPTQAPNLERENARPPHCNCIAYWHCSPAVWQRPQFGLCSSHFCRRALHLLQPVKDLDMSAMGWWDDVLGEEFLRGNGKLPGHNPPGKYNFWGTTIGGLSYYIGFYSV